MLRTAVPSHICGGISLLTETPSLMDPVKKGSCDMNSCQKEFKMLGSFVILGTVTTNNCEGLVLLSLLPDGSCPVLVPVKLDNGG